MRTAVISDMHFGDPYGCDLLQQQWARDPLWEAMQGADRLVLLGDVWELLFSSFADAVDASRPFFNDLAAHFPGIQVMVIPGNHDHHLALVAADEARAKQILHGQDDSSGRVSAAERVIEALAPGLDVTSAYPLYEESGVAYIHGHYMTSHLESFGWRTFDRLQWHISRQRPRKNNLTVADYEILMSPLYEVCYQVAQLPGGALAQKKLERRLNHVGKIAFLPLYTAKDVVGWSRGKIGRRRGELGNGCKLTQSALQRIPSEVELLEPGVHDASFEQCMRAMAEVAVNLGLDSTNDDLIFGHTHMPALDRRVEGCDLRFHNSGGWFLKYREAKRDMARYLDRARPGGVLFVTESDDQGGRDRRIELRRLLTPDQVEAHFRSIGQI